MKKNDQNKNYLKKKTLIFIIICCLLYFVFKLIIYTNGLVFFDEGIYVGISKYFASFGKMGYFESIRPLALPFFIMPMQLIPINSLISGRLVSLLLILTSIPSIYYSTKQFFKEKAAFWSTFIFSVSLSMIVLGGYILTDIPAYVLALLGTAFVKDKKYLFGGVAVGFGFLFKFPVLIIIIPIVVYIIIKERKILPIIKFCIGFGIISSFYFIFNLFYYGGSIFTRLFQPLINASKLIENPTWVYTKASIWIYMGQIIATETIAIFLFFYALIKNTKKIKESLIFVLSCMILFLSYFSFRVPRYDMRYVIPVLIFIIPISGLGAAKFVNSRKKCFILFISFIIFTIIGTSLFLLIKEPVKNNLFMKETIENYNGSKFITNNGISLLYSKSKVKLMPGPNLGHTYLTYREDKDAKWFILHPDGYPCPPNDNICQLNLNKKLSVVLEKNNILQCGYLNGARLIILTKEDSKISKEGCIKKIDYKNLEPFKSNTFIRISNVGFTPEGDIQNKHALNEIINIAKNNKIDIVLVLTSSKTEPNNSTINFIKNMPGEISLGILPSDDTKTNSFINKMYNLTGRKITIISPVGDEWNKKEIRIPKGINCSIVGSWDQTIIPVRKRQIDLYIVKDWEKNEIYDYEKLISWYEILSDCEDEIGIDIPLYLMNKDNFIKVREFIDYITKEK
jgi:hypothetical protein